MRKLAALYAFNCRHGLVRKTDCMHDGLAASWAFNNVASRVRAWAGGVFLHVAARDC